LNLGLALLVGGLAVFTVLVPPGRAPESPRPLVSVPGPEVQTIQVERAGKPKLLFAREPGGWVMRAPIRAPAHPQRIRDLLALPALPAGAVLEINAEELPRLGLSPPLATLSLDADQFEFGSTDGLDDRRYVRYRRQVRLLPDTVYPQLTQGTDFFIDTRLLKEGLRPERIVAPHRVVWLKDGAWLSDPMPAAGEPAADSIASAWEVAQALTVTSGVVEETGPRITLTFAQGITIEFGVVQHDDHVVLLRRDLGLRYEIDVEHARALMLIPGAIVAPPVDP